MSSAEKDLEYIQEHTDISELMEAVGDACTTLAYSALKVRAALDGEHPEAGVSLNDAFEEVVSEISWMDDLSGGVRTLGRHVRLRRHAGREPARVARGAGTGHHGYARQGRAQVRHAQGEAAS